MAKLHMRVSVDTSDMHKIVNLQCLDRMCKHNTCGADYGEGGGFHCNLKRLHIRTDGTCGKREHALE